MARPLIEDPDAQPYASMIEIELVGAGRFLRGWVLKTADTLEDVLTPAYFDNVYELGFKPFDRIEVTASAESERPQNALLVVDSVSLVPNAVQVSVLRGGQAKRAQS